MDTNEDAFSLRRPADHAPWASSPVGLAALLQGWWLRIEATDGRFTAAVGGPGLPVLCSALARVAHTPMWVLDGSTCATPEALAGRMRRQWPPVRLVLVDGIVELCDIEAIGRAITSGDSPFDAELRALIDLKVGEDAVSMEAVDPEAIDIVAAALLRAHVARCLHVPVEAVCEPDLDVVIRLRADSDLLLRPIETDVMAGSVDVGVGRTGNAPARQSIVYDRTTGQWHMG